jgi:tetratricopeptide (TPR) repeat protein
VAEKPVINEKFESDSPVESWEWQLPNTGASRKIKRQQTELRHEPTGKPAEDVSPENRFKKGVRLFRMKRWENALNEFLQVSTSGFTDEERADLTYYLGLCYTKMERFDDALQYLEQLVTLGGSPLRIYQCRMILAYIFIITDRIPLAESELKRLQGSGLESVMLYNTLAYAAYLQKNYMDAIDYYEKALDIEKDNPTALNSLGYILADTGLDKIKGLRLCRKAVEQNPDNAAYLDSVGWAAYKCGKLNEARSWLRKAADASPRESEIKRHLGIVIGGNV